MNWNPLRKLTKHGSKCHLLQSDEADFDKQVSRIEQLETYTKRLYKDAKKYEELILAVNMCEKKMTEDLSNSLVCQEEEILRKLVEEWHTFSSGMTDIDNELLKIIHQAVAEPLKRFQGIFPEARLAMKKREQTLQDCFKYKQKVQKLQDREKTGMNIVRLESAKQSLLNVEDDFKSQDIVLREELPLLYEGRIEYFQPSLEAIIHSQVVYSGESARIFNTSQLTLNQHNVSEMEMIQAQKERLSKLHSLSIVADK